MKHPSILDLALHSTGDLGLWRGFWVGRHARDCDVCRSEMEAFDLSRDTVKEGFGKEGFSKESFGAAQEGPQWNRLAAEMTANIRLGLAAGECVGPSHEAGEFDGRKAAFALATILILIVGSAWVFQRPNLNLIWAMRQNRPVSDEMVLKTTLGGIGVEQNGQTMALASEKGALATVTVGLQGSMDARYLDEDTGQVTIHHVYTE